MVDLGRAGEACIFRLLEGIVLGIRDSAPTDVESIVSRGVRDGVQHRRLRWASVFHGQRDIYCLHLRALLPPANGVMIVDRPHDVKVAIPVDIPGMHSVGPIEVAPKSVLRKHLVTIVLPPSYSVVMEPHTEYVDVFITIHFRAVDVPCATLNNGGRRSPADGQRSRSFSSC
jgi:hypothetical protein